MKRLFLLFALISLLAVFPNSFAQTAKASKSVIKYENGDKYIGAITKCPRQHQGSPFNGVANKKIRNGDGIMYYANGDLLAGYWDNDLPLRGTYTYANGDIFEGNFTTSQTPRNGKFTFANKGTIITGNKRWKYPAGSHFNGQIRNQAPYSGEFDCLLTTAHGDSFRGSLSSGQLKNGTIKYANGDIFNGSFINNTPAIGKYQYGSITEIKGPNYHWIIPAGGTFDGDIGTFTGAVNIEIVNNSGNTFIGRLKNGVPNKGTMRYAATGEAETGTWHDGLSPREIECQKRIQQRHQDSIAKVQADEQRIQMERKLAQERQEQLQRAERKRHLIQKYGQQSGTLLFNRKLELGMTKQMCEEVINLQIYDISKSRYAGHTVETWQFNKNKQNLQVVGTMSKLSSEEAVALAFLIGLADNMGASSPKYAILVFTDGKLTGIY